MKRIAFINQDSGYLMIDIVNCFDGKGYDCSIISGRIVERNVKLNPGIKKKRILAYNRSSTLKRISTWLIGSVQILFLCLFQLRSYHLFIVSNPPLAPIIPFFLRNNYSLLIFDVFPDALVEFGKIKNGSIIHRIWSLANEKVYRKAKHVFTLTEGMKMALSQYIDNKKIKVVPLWTSDGFLKPVPKEHNPFIIEHKLKDKFVVMYSGNFGLAHHLDTIIDLANITRDKRIMFVIIGGGPSEDRIKKKLINYNLRNCLILPWQDVSELPYSLASADLAIVTLSENASKLGIPSKIFGFMSVGAPILGISGRDSELSRMIINYNIGKSFTPDLTGEMITFVEELLNKHDLYNSYRTNSLNASKNHSSKNVEIISKFYV